MAIWQHFSVLQDQLLGPCPMPIILALSVESILPVLERYMKEFDVRQQTQLQKTPDLTTLVAHATTTAPMQPLSPHDANILTSHFRSLRHLEEATRTSSGRKGLTELLGPAVTKNLVDFWEDEWIA
ncbi:hypothetical protein LTR40_007350 [Exophiala xenobiotica]|nr:hypothetical protein LTR40_007350 [Exophiala xenobiotica]KAK5393959.1 hypothetical protein LTR79_008903 [Exophiala xenobiotica]KAK5408228.1 hypothetical protein LTR90_009684 [Exophiala xenobiotica]